MCDCIRLTNEALAAHNTALGLTWEVDRETGMVIEKVAIETWGVKKRRGARPMRLMASHCPLCGAPYPGLTP